MKNWITTIVLCCILSLGVMGCDENKVTPEQAQEFAERIKILTTKMDDYQAATVGALTTLESYGVVDADLIAKYERIDEEIDRVQPQIEDIAAAVKATQLTNDEIANWLAILQAANQASVPFNPYALPISAGLALAGFVYGLIKRKDANDKKVEAEKSALKYQAHKQGVEKTMKEVSALGSEEIRKVEPQLYNNIGEARVALGVK